MQYCYGQWLGEITDGVSLAQDDKVKLSKSYRESRELLIKASATGAYIISDDAAKVLKNIVDDLEKVDWVNDWFGHIDRCYGCIVEGIIEIRACAIMDLKVS